MAMVIRILVLLSSLLARAQLRGEDVTPVLVEDQRSRELSLEIGSAQTIPYPEGSRIRVSRRGVVDVQILDKHIRLTGLRQGFVTVTLSSDGAEEKDIKYFVQVEKAELVGQSTENLDFACRSAHLSYNREQESVTGSSADYQMFYRAKLLCQKARNCTHLATLSSTGQAKFIGVLANLLGSSYEVDVKANGAIHVLAPCREPQLASEHQKLVFHLIGNPWIGEHLFVSCRQDISPDVYKLFTKLIVMEKSVAEDIGLQSKLGAHASLSPASFKKNLELDLNAVLEHHKGEILGEPVLWLRSGMEAQVQSGSEIPTIRKQVYMKDEPTPLYVWKEVGLDLKVKILPAEKGKAFLQYTLIISNPPSGAEMSIHRNKLESEVELTVNQSMVVGGIQFNTKGGKEGSIPYLSSIPIIGPFLRSSAREEATTNLYLYFLLKQTG